MPTVESKLVRVRVIVHGEGEKGYTIASLSRRVVVWVPKRLCQLDTLTRRPGIETIATMPDWLASAKGFTQITTLVPQMTWNRD